MSVPVAAFRANKTKVVLLCVGSAAMCLASLVVSLGFLPNARVEGFAQVMIWIGVPLFGFFAFVWLKQLFDSGVVLEISENGIRDNRYSPAVVPWSVIDVIRSVELSYQPFLSLEIPADVQAKIPRPLYRKFFDVLNPLLGYKGMLVSMTGLNGTMKELVDAINAAAPPRLRNFT
jgi:hypothetical protein